MSASATGTTRSEPETGSAGTEAESAAWAEAEWHVAGCGVVADMFAEVIAHFAVGVIPPGMGMVKRMPKWISEGCWSSQATAETFEGGVHTKSHLLLEFQMWSTRSHPIRQRYIGNYRDAIPDYLILPISWITQRAQSASIASARSPYSSAARP